MTDLPLRQPELNQSFAQRVDILLRELRAALRHDRPSILLAIYASEFVRQEAEAALQEGLRAVGQTTTALRINEQNYDLLPLMAEHPARQTTVFFLSGLQWGGGKDGRAAYRALNIRREYFVDYQLRAVVWLTEREASLLPHNAPDFWAFRHRTVEFVDAPDPSKVIPLAHDLAWQGFEDRILREDTEAKIALRQSLLADLPPGEASLPARADLFYTLAGLYWAKRDYPAAIQYWEQALDGYVRLNHTWRQSWCCNGLGNVYRDMKRYEEALAAYQRSFELNPKDGVPHIGLGNVYSDLGRYDEALAAYQRALELDPKLTYAHNGLGNVYRKLGRYDEALAAYRRALELGPEADYAYNLSAVYRMLGRWDEALAALQKAVDLESQDGILRTFLAAVLRQLGRQAEAQEQLAIARPLVEKEDDYNRACFFAVSGEVEAALAALKAALEKQQSTLEWARRDPDLAALRDDPRFRALVGKD